MPRSADRPIEVRRFHPRLRFDRREVVRVFRVLERHRSDLAAPGAAPASGLGLSVAFLTAPALARLHADFCGDPSPTDVITFPGAALPGAEEEICVSADAAADYAARRGTNFSAELTLYLAHGWLHLAGHDDLRPGPKRAMRRAESRALRHLAAEDAFPRFRLD